MRNNYASVYISVISILGIAVSIIPAGVMAQRAKVDAANKTLNTRLNKEHYINTLKASENSISFQENKGQWEPNVLAQGHSNIGDLVIKKNEMYFLSLKPKEEEDEDDEHEEIDVHGWAISLEGRNPAFTVTKANPLVTKYNYFIGDDAGHYASDVSAYGEVTLQDIYKGIDLRLYSRKEKQVEFDWVVNAGADYRNIRMRFKGQDGLSIDNNGNLAVKLRFDEVKFDIPEAYQVIEGTKVPVRIAFALNGDEARFTITGKINNQYPLIIDPSLRWGVWMDGNDPNFDEYLFAVDEDASANVYCGGAINLQLTRSYLGAAIYGYDSTYNDPMFGMNGNARDGIIYEIKYDGTALLNVTYFGSTKPDAVYGLSLSPDKSTLFACGYCSGNIPMAGSPFDATRDTLDGFVAVFSSDLKTLKYTTYIGGPGAADRVVSIRPLNNTDFVIGGRVDAALPAGYISSAYDAVYGGNIDMYVASFAKYNNLVFGTYIGGNLDDDLNDLNVFSNGDVAFSGYTRSTSGFPGLVNAAGSAGSNYDGVVGVIPPIGGTFSMLSRIGGSDTDVFNGLTIGAGDTLYITGYTRSTNFPLGPGSNAGNRFRAASSGAFDALVGKLPKKGRPSGPDPWIATFFGGTGNERGNTIRSYGAGTAIMIFGETGSQAGGASGFPVMNLKQGVNTFYDSVFNGGTWDMFFFAIGTDLKTELFCTYIGGKNNDYLGETGIAAGSNHFMVEGDSIIVLGTTSHSDTLKPTVIGPITGPNAVFDYTHGVPSLSRDVHLIFKWRIGTLLDYDFGDAPRIYGAACHTIIPNLALGVTTDAEDFYPVNPGGLADADDNKGIDDEDALSNPVFISDTATQFSITVPLMNTTGKSATLMGWIDFNRDSIFSNSEGDTAQVQNGATSATLTWTGFYSSFNTGTGDTTYLRIRLTTDPAFNVQYPNDSNRAIDGEVEDYMVIRMHCGNLINALLIIKGPPICDDTTGSITILNSNLQANMTYTVYYNKDSVLLGPFNLQTQNNGNLVITGLAAGTYSGIKVQSLADSLCRGIYPGIAIINNPVSSFGDTVAVACENFTWYGNLYSTSTNTPKHVFLKGNRAGCDSTVTLHLTINPITAGVAAASACDSYTWFGTIYTASNNVSHLLPGGNAHGCDSSVTLNLVINKSTATVTSTAACDNYNWNGTMYTSGGTVTHYFPGGNAHGCDSTSTLNLIINNSSAGNETVTACTSYAWHGTTYTANANATHLFPNGNAAGCDSMSRLSLFINHTTMGVNSTSACDSYLWQGTLYTTSGTYSHLFLNGNSAGCDSTAFQNLTITRTFTVSQIMVTCDTFTWAKSGKTYTSSGDYGVLNGALCTSDSLHLTILKAPAPIITVDNYCGYSTLTITNRTGFVKWSTADTSSSIVITSSGIYSAIQIEYGCRAATSIYAEVWPASPPTPNITIKDDTLYCSHDTSYFSYQWYFNTVLIPGATSDHCYAPNSGNYNVAVYDKHGCGIAVGINIIVTETNNYDWINNSIKILPVPASNEIYVYAEGLQNKEVNVAILNVIGEAVKQKAIKWKGVISFEIYDMAPGLYYLQIKSSSGNFVKRFLKE